MSYHDTERKTEAAILGLLTAGGVGGTHYHLADDALTLPAVIVGAKTGEEAILHTGTWRMNCEIEIRSQGKSSGSETSHAALVGSVRDLVVADDFVDELNAQGIDNFVAHAFRVSGISENPDPPRAFSSTLSLELIVSAQ